MSHPKPKKSGPEPERLKVEGDPQQALQRLFRPLPEKPRKQGKRRK